MRWRVSQVKETTRLRVFAFTPESPHDLVAAGKASITPSKKSGSTRWDGWWDVALTDVDSGDISFAEDKDECETNPCHPEAVCANRCAVRSVENGEITGIVLFVIKLFDSDSQRV